MRAGNLNTWVGPVALLALGASAGCSLPGYNFQGRYPDGGPDGAAMDRAEPADARADGSGPDIADAPVDMDTSVDMDTGADTGVDMDTGVDTGADTGVDTGADVPAVDVSTGTCSPSEALASPALFVDARGSTTGDGSMANPFPTITQAVTAANAMSGPVTIYLAPGVYRGALSLPAGTRALRISGGFSPTGGAWARNCTMVSAAWTLGSDVDEAVRVAASMGEVSFERLTIQTRLVAAPGVTQYGVFVGATGNVALRFVNVVTNQGGAGVPGVAGTPARTTTTCDRVACDRTSAAGTGGVSGNVGAAAMSAGSVTAVGFTPANGSRGAVGNPGFAGRPGGVGETRMQNCAGCNGDICDTTCAGRVEPPCMGRPQRACTVTPRTLQSTAGLCGCGGNAGAGAEGGGGGGASIGVFAAPGARLVIEDSSLRSGPGGAGGIGGAGGAGFAGSGGERGMDESCSTACGTMWSVCNCFVDMSLSRQVTAVGGMSGTAGGRGGDGGRGGNGAGGSSFALAASMTATVTVTRSALVAGSPGVGGAITGTTAGAAGASAMRVNY